MVHPATKRVTGLSLGSLPLKAPILPEVSALTELEFVDLQQSQITGSLPAELGALKNLEALYLRGNNLTGHIPPRLGDLANLEELDLAENQLGGDDSSGAWFAVANAGAASRE